MKYVKTFENFSQFEPINEEEFIKAVKAWWQKQKQELGNKMVDAIKKNPEAMEKLKQAKAEFAKLPEEDKKRTKEIATQENLPDPKTDPGGKVEEGAKEVVGTILKWLGYSVAAIAFVGLLIAVIKIAIVGSGFVMVLGGLCTLGNLIGILMGTAFVSSMIGAAGGAMTE